MALYMIMLDSVGLPAAEILDRHAMCHEQVLQPERQNSSPSQFTRRPYLSKNQTE